MWKLIVFGFAVSLSTMALALMVMFATHARMTSVNYWPFISDNVPLMNAYVEAEMGDARMQEYVATQYVRCEYKYANEICLNNARYWNRRAMKNGRPYNKSLKQYEEMQEELAQVDSAFEAEQKAFEEERLKLPRGRWVTDPTVSSRWGKFEKHGA